MTVRSISRSAVVPSLTMPPWPVFRDATPVAELTPEEMPRLVPLPTPDEKPKDRLKALRHYLPFFGKKR